MSTETIIDRDMDKAWTHSEITDDFQQRQNETHPDGLASWAEDGEEEDGMDDAAVGAAVVPVAAVYSSAAHVVNFLINPCRCIYCPVALAVAVNSRPSICNLKALKLVFDQHKIRRSTALTL